MTEVEHFDILVFGGGKGGKTLAMDRARNGQHVAMIEAGMIGGSCINVACIPSKALIRSAERAAFVEDAAEFGIEISTAKVEMKRVAERTAAVVHGMVAINQAGFDASGLELVLGWGHFVEPRVVEVKTPNGYRRLTAPSIYLNLGTRARLPDIPGLLEAKPLTHVEALSLQRLPQTLVIVGGGYIGMELAQAFQRLGSAVVLLEEGSSLAAREDGDMAAAITTVLKDTGVRIVTNACVSHVLGTSGASIIVETTNGCSYAGSDLLIATGRTPMTADIGLDIAGVDLDKRGFVLVDSLLKTSASGIWALGDVAGTPMFTHASLDDFRVAKSQIVGAERTTEARLIPYCMFIDPEFARVGMSEREADKAGVPYRLVVLQMTAVPRARTMSAQAGFMKCLLSARDDSILGFAMLGERAGEVMTIVQIAMLGGLPYTLLRDAIFTHPTIAEGLGMLFSNVEPLQE